MTFDWLWKIFDSATPGPWDFIHTKSANVHLGDSLNGPDTFEDAEFIAWCGTNRKLLRDVIDAAEDYVQFMSDIGYGVALKYSGQMQTANKLREALTALKASAPKEEK